jgi:PAS domain S-box-containing protein
VDYTGVPETEQMGYRWLEQLHPDDRELTVSKWMEKVKTGESFDMEFRIRRNDGIYHWFKTRAVPMRDSDGSIVKWFGSNTDFDEIIKAQEQLKAFSNELEIKVRELDNAITDLKRSNQELEQFAYVASHDLQEPLRMVSSYTQLLERRYKDQLDQDARDFIFFAVDGANRMQHLINDLLDYSRVTTRGKPFVKLDLSTVLGHAIANLQKKVQETGAMIVNDDLPFVYGDEVQLVRVFQNLLDNAMKFRGADPPRINVSAKTFDEKIQISITDNGIGIDKIYSDRVFTIFQRLHTKIEYPGTGIGLAICKRTIERHGGKIWFESEPGKGTTFSFTLNFK